MTSPYLTRPKRSLDQALKDTGRAPHELGMGAPPVPAEMRQLHAKGHARLSRSRVAIAFALGLALLAGTTFVALKTEFEQPIASDTESGSNTDLVPAAGASGSSGPEQPAADIQNWGDAPSLQLPANKKPSD